MMTLEETTKIYASVLRQLLPAGGYDTAQNTVIAADVYAHAKALAQADLDAKRLLSVLNLFRLNYLLSMKMNMVCRSSARPTSPKQLKNVCKSSTGS